MSQSHSFYLHILSSIAHVVSFQMLLPLLYLRKPPAEQLAWLRASLVCVCLCRCASASRQDVRSIYAGEVNPVTLTCCGLKPPHPHLHSHSSCLSCCCCRCSRSGVFLSKTPKVIFSSTSHTSYLKPCTSRKGRCATLFFFFLDCFLFFFFFNQI